MSGDGQPETPAHSNARVHKDLESRTSVIGRPRCLELFGEFRDWKTLGHQHGFRRIGVDEPVKAIASLYDSVLQTELLQHTHDHERWQADTDQRNKRRETELKPHRDEVDRLEAAADPTAPDSVAAQESRMRDNYRQQLETASSICELVNADDINAAAAKKSNALKRQFADNLARTHLQHSQDMLDRYANHTRDALDNIARLKNALRNADASSPTDQQMRDELAKEIEELKESPERRALDEMATLIAAAPTPQFETITHRTRPPSWWRTHLWSYQLFVLFGLAIAISADQFIMQQLTVPFLGLRTLERWFSDLAEHARDGFWNLRVLFDSTGIVFAIVFGFMPILLSMPIRRTLEQIEHDHPESSQLLNKLFGGAVVFFLVAIFGITAVDSSGSLQQVIKWGVFDVAGLWRGVAMLAITGVLAIATALISHQVFHDKASYGFIRYMRKDEPDRLHQSIQQSEARIAGIMDRAHVERQRLRAIEEHHAQEDARSAASDPDFATKLSAAFEEAKKAAQAAYRTGHALGERAFERGFELSGDDRDFLPLETLVTILLQKRLTEGGAVPDSGHDTDPGPPRTGHRPKGPSSSTATSLPIQ
jgi:hypothetical protein